MSMNLNAKVDGVRLNLWQTPTRISYTIIGDDREVYLKGKEAQKALKRYYQWVKYSTNGSSGSIEELNEAIERVQQYLEYLLPYLSGKKIEVWVM